MGKTLRLFQIKNFGKCRCHGNLGPGFSGTPVQLNTEGIEVDHQCRTLLVG